MTLEPSSDFPIDDIRSVLSGLHFAQESLTDSERQIFRIAEKLLGELDRIHGGFMRPGMEVAAPADGTTTLTVDSSGVRVMINALDLYQRVAIGQWRDVAEHAPAVLGNDAHCFSPVADQLIAIRAAACAGGPLGHPSASLSIRGAHADAQIAYDMWHALGGGMDSRRDDRLTSTIIDVTTHL
jgi:hypothetical protein